MNPAASDAGSRRIYPIRETVQETPSTVTIRFEDPSAADPGQFVMLWLPGDDELPMSLSYTGRLKGVTVKAMGATSRRVLALATGDRVGVRGPYGNRFDLSPRRILVVGGGSGTAVLAPAAEAAQARGSEVTAALGATTAAEMLFAERLASSGVTVHVATDDGSRGHSGYVTVVADRLLGSGRFDAVWTCGPEIMMRKVLASARAAGVAAFGSVERQMKCSLGLCDACALGPYHVCIDGPVFPGAVLEAEPEFGRLKRDPSGRRVAV
ncbi:MAG TPA: dihydroorotate dehydrogenase electron transfer subunit [Thermoplasmata archaeon]|nr:dihydroorotate dehydrogenase electron transfer subunit [Thermoplasmata archaeon]